MQLTDRFRVINGRLGECVDIRKCCCQGFGVDFAHVVDAQGVELASPGLGAGRLHRRHEVFGAFLAHPFQAAEQCDIEAIQIRDRAHQTPLHKLFDQFPAHALHIEGALADPMAQSAAQDRRAAAVHAAGCGFTAFPHQLGLAAGALMRKIQGLSTFGPELWKHPQHFGDDLSGLAHHDRVAAV